MGLFTRIATAVVASSSLWLQPCLAQDSTIVSKYKDDSTNITFGMYGIDAIVDASTGDVAQGFYNFGIVLPDNALKKDANEYIGMLVSQRHICFAPLLCDFGPHVLTHHPFSRDARAQTRRSPAGVASHTATRAK